MRLENKVALISGGARAMGAAEAQMFAREGAKVVIGDVLDAEGTRVAAEIAESGGDALFVHLDVTHEEDWRSAIGAATSSFSKLDILVNNAGIWRRGRVEDTTVEDWDMILDVNAKGVFLGTKLAIPEMRKAGGGSIINISSTAGLVGGPRSSAYTASGGRCGCLRRPQPFSTPRGRHQGQLHTSRPDRYPHDSAGLARRRTEQGSGTCQDTSWQNRYSR